MAGRHQLDREELLQRVRERSAGVVAEISTILLGGVLSAAGFGMIEILRHPSEWPVRAMLWLISMIACFVAYFRLATRAPFYMSSGTAVFVAMPLIGVSEIMLFAALTLDGPGAWRYWFLAGVAMAVTGAITNVLELRRLSPRHYAANAEAAFVHLRAKLRTEAAESVGLIFVTAGMGATVWALPRNWPYFTNLMGGYLVVSLLIALVIVPREARETEALVAVLLAESEGADVSDSATNFS